MAFNENFLHKEKYMSFVLCLFVFSVLSGSASSLVLQLIKFECKCDDTVIGLPLIL